MHRKRIVFSAAAPALMGLAVGMLAGVGRPQFAQALLATLQPLLPASHCTVFSLDDAGVVSAVSQASAYGDVATATATRYIKERFYQRDPNVRWLAARKTSARPQAWLVHQQADEIADADYRQACFGNTGIRERLALLLLGTDGRRFIVSLYRNLALADYTPADRQQLEALAPLIDAALLAHLRITQGELHGEPRRSALFPQLSGRERQVITHVVAGRTTADIAALLALSANTVLTYRYRAFRSLGIRTQRELLALVAAPRSALPSGDANEVG